jgi:hypothetical protein
MYRTWCLAQDGVSVDAWAGRLEPGDSAERHALSQIMDTKSTTKAKQVAAIVDEYLNARRGPAGARARVSPHVVAAVVARCTAKDKPVWADEALTQLLKTGAVSARACPGLVQAILDHNAADALAMALVHCNDVSETELVAVMRHVLRGDGSAAFNKYYRETVHRGPAEGKACGGGGG